MVSFRFSSSGPQLRRENSAPTLAASFTPTELSSTAGPSTAVRDMIGQDVTTELAPTAVMSSNPSGAVFTTITPSATVDGTLITTSGVSARVAANLNGRGVWFDVPYRFGSSTTYSITEFEATSLTRHIYEQLLSLTTGHTNEDSSIAAFSEYSGSITSGTLSVTRNTAGLMASIDTSCVSVSRSNRTDDAFPVTMISGRHGYTATHVIPPVGTVYAFLSTTGVMSYGTVASSFDLGADAAVIYFDAIVTGVTPAKTFPATIGNKISLPGSVSAFPCIHKTMHRMDGTWRSCWLPQVISGFVDDYIYTTQNAIYATKTTLRAALSQFQYDYGIGGDSGSPWFAVVAGELCLLGAWYSGVSAGNILFSKRADE